MAQSETVPAALMRRARRVGVIVVVGTLALSGVLAQETSAASPIAPVPGSPFPAPAGATPTAVGFSPDGNLLALANLGTDDVSMFSVAADGTLTSVGQTPAGDGPHALAFSRSGNLLATVNSGTQDPTISVFSVAADGALSQVSWAYVDEGDPSSVAFNASGDLLATANDDAGSVSVYQVAPGGGLTWLSDTEIGSQEMAVAFSPSGNLLATGDFDTGQVWVFSIAGRGVLTQVGSGSTDGSSVNSLAFSPSGHLLAASGTYPNKVSVFSVSDSGALSAVSGSPFATTESPQAVAFSSSGELLATANYETDNLSVFSVGSSGALSPLDGSPFDIGVGTGPWGLAFSPTQPLLATANADGRSVSVLAVDPSLGIDPPPAGGTPTTADIAAPVIGEVTPAEGSVSGGQQITISATNLTDATEVLFDGVPARELTVERYDRVTAVTPAHAAGPVAVTVRTPAGTSPPAVYTYRDDATSAAQTASGGGPLAEPTRGCVVPDLRGRTIAAARARLRAAGCALGRVRRTRARHGAPTPRVIRQSPLAATRHAAGQRVAVTTRMRA